MRRPGRALNVILLGLVLALSGALAPPGQAKDVGEIDDGKPWFTNITKKARLEGTKAKDVILTDLDQDGYWDLCVDRQHLYRSEKGKRFHPIEHPGLEFPSIRHVPLTRTGRPDEAKAKRKTYVPHYLYFADVDNDGDPDALWGVKSHWEHPGSGAWKTVEEADHGLRSRVYINNGTGNFTLGSSSGYTAKDAAGPAMALAIVDVDEDGCLDLFEGREYRVYGVLHNCGVDRLWKGDGTGRFTDGTEAAGLMTLPDPAKANSSRPTYGVTHADWNGDGWQDLLALSYGRQWNRLWKNNGDGTFTDVGMETGFAGDDITHGKYPDWRRQSAEAPFRSNGNTFDCAVGDVDADGDLDYFLGEIQHAWAGESSDPPSLLICRGEGEGWKFQRISVQEGLPPRALRGDDERTWNWADLHAAFLDVDNDTRLDLLIASGDYPDGQFLRLYRQKKDGSFEDMTKQAGFDWEGCGDISVGDIDRDGDVDIVAGRSFMRLNQAHRDKYMNGLKVNEIGIFRNDIAKKTKNKWLNVQLVGKGKGFANRAGIGARILVRASAYTQMREIRCGSGLSNHQDPPEACFGLGDAKRVTWIEVHWPGGEPAVQRFESIPVNRFVTLTQGEKQPAWKAR